MRAEIGARALVVSLIYLHLRAWAALAAKRPVEFHDEGG